MKAMDKGRYYVVVVSSAEIRAFNANWPCSRLPNCRLWFEFDKRNGDLVDIGPARVAERVDGPEALALSQDAQAYGCKRLGIEAS